MVLRARSSSPLGHCTLFTPSIPFRPLWGHRRTPAFLRAHLVCAPRAGHPLYLVDPGRNLRVSHQASVEAHSANSFLPIVLVLLVIIVYRKSHPSNPLEDLAVVTVELIPFHSAIFHPPLQGFLLGEGRIPHHTGDVIAVVIERLLQPRAVGFHPPLLAFVQPESDSHVVLLGRIRSVAVGGSEAVVRVGKLSCDRDELWRFAHALLLLLE
mmetsp:Transcript_3525/g.7138  ORF Transcript_3525/g.7138 Transcript_3525/m.7138 type:complete len:211 (-) Transcript_3525:320-952(-)